MIAHGRGHFSISLKEASLVCESSAAGRGVIRQPRKVTISLFSPPRSYHLLSKWRRNAIFAYESTAEQIARAVLPAPQTHPWIATPGHGLICYSLMCHRSPGNTKAAMWNYPRDVSIVRLTAVRKHLASAPSRLLRGGGTAAAARAEAGAPQTYWNIY